VDHSTIGLGGGGTYSVVEAPEYVAEVLLLKLTGKPVAAADGG
jgi:hypothetical protein